MFKNVLPSNDKVRITFEESPLVVNAGISVAAAVLSSGRACSRRTGRAGAERNPYCGMGVCYECLMEIDGLPNQQSCMITVREGMRVRRQIGDPNYTEKRAPEQTSASLAREE